MTLSPFWCLYPEYPIPSPPFCDAVDPVAMQDAEVKVLLGGKMRHTGNERLLKRAIIGPFSKGSVHI
jgi:hypothetical protein